MLSLSGIVLLTNRVVPAIEEDEQFVPALHNRPDNTGLRGKMVLGRMWDSSATNSENNSGSKKENNAPTSNTNDNNSKMPIPEDTLKSNLQQIVEDVHPKKLEEVVHNNPTPTALHAAGM